jgi:hypothetical protein
MPVCQNFPKHVSKRVLEKNFKNVKIFEEDLFAKILRNKVFAKKFEVLV